MTERQATAKQTVSQLLQYFAQRNVPGATALVTEDIHWVDTGSAQFAVGKESLAALLHTGTAAAVTLDIKEENQNSITMDNLCELVFGTAEGTDAPPLHYTCLCVTQAHCCLVSHMHLSSPSENPLQEEPFAWDGILCNYIMNHFAAGLAEIRLNPYRLLHISDSLYTMLGYTKEDFVKSGRTFASIQHPQDAPWVVQSIKEQCAGDGPLFLEYRVIKKDGSVGWVQLEGTRITKKNGAQHMLVVYKDMTELRLLQLELQNLTHTIPGGIIKIDMDEKKIIYANDFFYEMNGYTREAYEKIVQANAFALIHPNDRQRIYDALMRTTGNQQTLTLEYRFQLPDRTWAWRILSGKIHIDQDGRETALCMVIDNAEQKQLELSLRMEKEQYRIVTELSGSTLWSLNFAERQMPDLGLYEIYKSDTQKLKKFFNRCRLGAENLSLEFRAHSKKDSGLDWYRIEAALLRDSHDHVIKAIGKLTNIQQEKQKNMELRHATQHDGMTGLFNKTYMQQVVNEVLSGKKYNQKASFLIVDVDNFKQVNDKLGHLFGDTVLVNIAQAIQDSIPKNALAGRVGGDEFVILTLDMEKADVDRVAKTLCDRIRDVYAGELKETQISCSIGVSHAPKQGKTYLALFRNADEALYLAKKSGKNTVRHFSGIRVPENSGSALLNNYQMDETPLPLGSGTGDMQEFSNWVTSLLSTTKDLDSAIQLVLDKYCSTYLVDHLFIAEHTPVGCQVKISYLRSRKNMQFMLKRYDTFDAPGWITLPETQPQKQEPPEETVTAMFSACLPPTLSKAFLEKAMLPFGIYNDCKCIACVFALMDDTQHVWTLQERNMLHQITAVLTPYLIKKQIADETAYKMDRALHYDELTALPLLSHFKNEAQRRLDEDATGSYAIICSDIYNFKFINDTYGFAAGDEVLRAFAYVLSHGANKRSICAARMTNDKFIAMVPFTKLIDLKEHIARTHDEIRDHIQQKIQGITLFINAGICTVKVQENGITQAIDNANIARKSVKGKAKDTCRFYDEGFERRLQVENEMASHMEDALEQGEFEVYLQPKVCTYDGTLNGAEALIRWNRPGGMIYPNDFIPFFEKNGFITKVDEFVFIQVLRTLQKWLKTFGRAVPISLNLSRLHGDNPNKVQEILDLTKQYQVPSSCLEFELTETALYDDANRLKLLMQKLIENGYSVSIDDFGSGYSSLNTIASLPANIIKLDKGFLEQDGEKSYNRIVVKHIIAMAKEMGFSIICEGVETEKQVAFLKTMDCEMAQGYYYAKPMPIKMFEEKYFK